jgi:hypothetical protein
LKHYDLCKIVAQHFLKKNKIALFEYQGIIFSEFPDVLCFNSGYSTLFEIKVGRQDFLKDKNKKCRIEQKVKYFPRFSRNSLNKINGINWGELRMEEFIQEMPHLGRHRYYVCPNNLINPDEINNGWGLYWYNGNRFRKKKESKNFKVNMHEELIIMEHAFRKYYCEAPKNILINGYK